MLLINLCIHRNLCVGTRPSVTGLQPQCSDAIQLPASLQITKFSQFHRIQSDLHGAANLYNYMY